MWPQVKDLIAKSTKYSNGDLEANDILTMIFTEKYHLWIFFNHGELQQVMVTQLERRPKQTVCIIIALAGYNLPENWEIFSEYLITWAKENGASKLEARCRSEVLPKFQALGFVEESHLISFSWRGQS